MREFRILRRIFFIICIIAIVIFIIYAFYTDYNAKQTFLNKKYEGLITEVKFIDGMSDFPSYKINNQWIYFGMIPDIAFDVKIGDSIVKKQGQAEIEVYRRDTAGEWVKLEFE